MSTRSAIIIQDSPHAYRGIYCHFDGYLEGVGQQLAQNYTDRATVESLIALGSISVLGHRVTPVGAHSFNAPEEGTTIAYHRDRGEPLYPPAHGSTVKQVADQIGHDGHVYVYRLDGKWTHNGRVIKPKVIA